MHELLRRQRVSQRAFHRLLGTWNRGARWVEREDGLGLVVTPTRPERSLVNAVVYEEPTAVVAALPELAATYDEAGVDAWTVWIRPGDEAVAAACAAAGHHRDATPAAMGAVVEDVALSVPAGVRFAAAPDWHTMAVINDAAYGLPEDHFAAIMDRVEEPGVHLAVAHDEAGPASCAAALVTEGNAEVVMVATLPRARGRGLASACMADVLRRARDEDGAGTTTLEASAAGRPVYERLGYRTLGILEMWERRH